MKLYVWENVLCDYSCGIAFALAETAEAAREAIVREYSYSEQPTALDAAEKDRLSSEEVEDYRAYRRGEHKGYAGSLWEELDAQPLEVATEKGFYVWGGG